MGSKEQLPQKQKSNHKTQICGLCNLDHKFQSVSRQQRHKPEGRHKIDLNFTERSLSAHSVHCLHCLHGWTARLQQHFLSQFAHTVTFFPWMQEKNMEKIWIFLPTTLLHAVCSERLAAVADMLTKLSFPTMCWFCAFSPATLPLPTRVPSVLIPPTLS